MSSDSPPSPHVVAVVLPFGLLGSQFAREVRRLGGRPVAVTLPAGLLPAHYHGARIEADAFDGLVDGASTVTAVAALREWGVTAVLAGTEIAVGRTDAVAEVLGLPGNAPATTRLRRDKGAMAVALSGAGVAVPRTLVTSRVADALEWAEWLGADVVLKPLDSAGSQGVTLCTSGDELAAAWERLHGAANAMGGVNDALVVQERVRGEQYIVNAVTIPGADGWPVHVVTEVWRDRRAGDAGSLLPAGPWHLYDRADLLSLDDPFVTGLVRFVERALAGLDVRYGPTHTEIMVTGRGPVLIEVGARPMGTYHPGAVQLATGSDHVRDTVSAAMTGRVADRYRDPLNLAKVTLASPVDGCLDGPALHRLLELPTVAGHVGNLMAGAPVTRTRDLLTAPGRLMLAGGAAAVDRDHQSIRRIEASGLYRPLPWTTSCTR